MIHPVLTSLFFINLLDAILCVFRLSYFYIGSLYIWYLPLERRVIHEYIVIFLTSFMRCLFY